jgi:hypothetical protein
MDAYSDVVCNGVFVLQTVHNINSMNKKSETKHTRFTLCHMSICIKCNVPVCSTLLLTDGKIQNIRRHRQIYAIILSLVTVSSAVKFCTSDMVEIQDSI